MRGLPASGVRVEETRLDGEHGNAYAAWLRMGSPGAPTGEQVGKLVQASKLQEATATLKTDGATGSATMDMKLERNGAVLLRLAW